MSFSSLFDASEFIFSGSQMTIVLYPELKLFIVSFRMISLLSERLYCRILSGQRGCKGFYVKILFCFYRDCDSFRLYIILLSRVSAKKTDADSSNLAVLG